MLRYLTSGESHGKSLKEVNFKNSKEILKLLYQFSIK